jgi:beta-glucanase (GH16 family)/endonuclease YncB( thermonuclease family)
MLLLAEFAAGAKPVQNGKGATQTIKSHIVGVIDGDTIRVRASGPVRKPVFTVRLIGIDAPASGKPGVAAECGAREAASSMLALGFGNPRDTDGDALFDEPGGRGRAVRLVIDRSQGRFDRAERLLAHGDLRGGSTLAEAQLNRGWSTVVVGKRFSRLRSFRRALARARGAGRGVWSLCDGDFHRPLAETESSTSPSPPVSTVPWPDPVSPVVVPPPADQPDCSDGRDNDGDGRLDFGAEATNDPGCLSPADDSEATDSNPQCSDELDNDSDGAADHPADPGCDSPTDGDETDPPTCSDGRDNDADGDSDLADRGCVDAEDADEGNTVPTGELTWSDEFSAPAGTSPDAANWTMRTGGAWSGGAELQCYTKRPENISHDGQGRLRITARYEPANGLCADGPNAEYTSGRIDSLNKREFQYGTIEARMRLPGGAGTFPAFWMIGDSVPGFETWPARGEVDILEGTGTDSTKAHHAVHGARSDGTHWQKTANTVVPGTDWTAGWHVYGIAWSENRIEYQIDGVTRWTLTPSIIPATAPWVFNKEFHFLLNLAIGRFGGTPNPADYPRELLVDWVRVYQTP